MCDICEQYDDPEVVDQDFVNCGIFGEGTLNLTFYREKEEAPLKLNATLWDFGDDDIIVGYTCKFCPECGKKLF